MRSTVDEVQRWRVFVSICAASVGVLICAHQRHFTLSFAHPRSFLTMTHHKCGDVLLASVVWMLFEVGLCCFRVCQGASNSGLALEA
jgi:hypothetical protein